MAAPRLFFRPAHRWFSTIQPPGPPELKSTTLIPNVSNWTRFKRLFTPMEQFKWVVLIGFPMFCAWLSNQPEVMGPVIMDVRVNAMHFVLIAVSASFASPCITSSNCSPTLLFLFITCVISLLAMQRAYVKYKPENPDAKPFQMPQRNPTPNPRERVL
jgi:hypothetical protein